MYYIHWGETFLLHITVQTLCCLLHESILSTRLGKSRSETPIRGHDSALSTLLAGKKSFSRVGGYGGVGRERLVGVEDVGAVSGSDTRPMVCGLDDHRFEGAL